MAAGLCSLAGSQGESIPFPFQLPVALGISPAGGCPIPVPWISYKDFSLDVGPSWVIWQSLSLKILAVIMASKTLFQIRSHADVLGLRTWDIQFGGCYDSDLGPVI